MAAQALDHPQSSLHRSALAYAAGELIRAHGDAAVLRAIDLASDLKVAQAIRHAAEAACEAVSTSSRGVERQARLFSIAIIVQFAEPLTAQELGDRLVPIIETGSLLAHVQECSAYRCLRSIIWPHVWAFEDLARLSLSDVRQSTITATSASVAGNGGMEFPFPPSAYAQRRCTTFLRYLVGYQVGSEATMERRRCLRFADCVRGVTRAILSDAQDIAVIYDGRFYGTLWRGLRAYQACRLAHVAAGLAVQGMSAPGLAASVGFTWSRNEMSARIAFLWGGKKLDQHVYHILLEPQTDPTTAVARIVAPLRSLGVKVHVAREVTCISRPLKHNRGAPRSFATFELTLPL
jgi:hypothetical protein